MAHFRSLLRSGCVAMQLALCLVMGLRLVSASVIGSDCLRSANLPASHPASPWLLNTTARTSKKHSAGTSGGSEAATEHQINKETRSSEYSTAEGRRPSSQFGSTEPHKIREEPGRIGLDQIVSDHFGEAIPSGKTLRTRQAISVVDPSPDPSSSWSPGSAYQPLPSDSSPGGQENASEYTEAGSYSPSTTSSSDDSSNFGSFSSSSSSTSSTYQQLPSAVPSSLPNIDDGGPNDASSSLPPSSANTTIATTPQQPHQTSSSRLTTALAVGVTVPVLLIGLGLMALAWLYKRRQRESAWRQDHETEGKPDEETARVTPWKRTSHTVPAQHSPAKDVSGHIPPNPDRQPRPKADKTAPDAGQDPFPGPQDERPDTSRSTGASSQVTSVVTFELPLLVPRTSDAPSDSSQSVGVTSEATDATATTMNRTPTCARSRSLKRKPVPPLIDN